MPVLAQQRGPAPLWIKEKKRHNKRSSSTPAAHRGGYMRALVRPSSWFIRLKMKEEKRLPEKNTTNNSRWSTVRPTGPHPPAFGNTNRIGMICGRHWIIWSPWAVTISSPLHSIRNTRKERHSLSSSSSCPFVFCSRTKHTYFRY